MYYPKSQILSSQYTNGGELIYDSSKLEYKGYYFKTSNGQYYSGKTPQSPNSERLLLLEKQYNDYQNPQIIRNQESLDSTRSLLPKESVNIVGYNLDPSYNYATKNRYSSKKITAPVNHKVFPTENDYNLSQFQRYFLKKINTPLFKEVPQELYLRYTNKDEYVQYDLYLPIKFMWTLTGVDKNTVANINYNILELAERRYKATGLVNYFKNKLTEYYKEVGS
jgi:hypothetical protein